METIYKFTDGIEANASMCLRIDHYVDRFIVSEKSGMDVWQLKAAIERKYEVVEVSENPFNSKEMSVKIRHMDRSFKTTDLIALPIEWNYVRKHSRIIYAQR